MTAHLLDPLAPFLADVALTKLRLAQAATPIAYNLALANYAEAQHTLRGAQRALGTTALAA